MKGGMKMKKMTVRVFLTTVYEKIDEIFDDGITVTLNYNDKKIPNWTGKMGFYELIDCYSEWEVESFNGVELTISHIELEEEED